MTVERDGAAEAYDCKWGARGINADVLHQLDDARTHAADEDEPLRVALVVFDARRSCEVRLGRQTAPHDATGLVTLETLDELADGPMTGPRAGRLLRPVPRPFRRGGAGRARSGRRSSCATPRTWPGSTRRRAASGATGTRSAA